MYQSDRSKNFARRISFLCGLDEAPAPSFMTISNFMNDYLKPSIGNIFAEINNYIFEQENVDTNHIYIDGTKITANANKYSWVWKKSCIKNRQKVFAKVTSLLEEMNQIIAVHSVKFEIREEYAIEYLEEIREKFVSLTGMNPEEIVRGRGHRKTAEQRQYDTLSQYIERLKKYAEHIKICDDNRNSCSKTGHDAAFMRMKRDYMGNDQLLPGYNIQLAIFVALSRIFSPEPMPTVQAFAVFSANWSCATCSILIVNWHGAVIVLGGRQFDESGYCFFVDRMI